MMDEVEERIRTPWLHDVIDLLLTKDIRNFVIDGKEYARVEHGHWIALEVATEGNGTKTRFRCDQCNHYVDIGTDRNFCPNCGAKMDKSCN